MIINNSLLQDASFRQDLEANFKLIEQNIEEGTLWGCGITSKDISIVRKNDSIIDKIVFFVKKLFGRIDTSYASMQELKQRVKLVELTELTDKITKAQQSLDSLNHENTSAAKDFHTNDIHIKAVKQVLGFLNASVSAKKGEITELEEIIAAKKKDFEFLEFKLKSIAKEEELEAKLQAKRLVTQAITKEIEEITEGLGAKHAELISRIGKTELGVAGWLANAHQMIKEKEKTLKGLLQKDSSVKPDNDFEAVLNDFRTELFRLRNLIPLIINSKEYADFLTQLEIIKTTGWSMFKANKTYTVTPNLQSNLQKTILREIEDLAKLTFTRSQMMALTK